MEVQGAKLSKSVFDVFPKSTHRVLQVIQINEKKRVCPFDSAVFPIFLDSPIAKLPTFSYLCHRINNNQRKHMSYETEDYSIYAILDSCRRTELR